VKRRGDAGHECDDRNCGCRCSKAKPKCAPNNEREADEDQRAIIGSEWHATQRDGGGKREPDSECDGLRNPSRFSVAIFASPREHDRREHDRPHRVAEEPVQPFVSEGCGGGGLNESERSRPDRRTNGRTNHSTREHQRYGIARSSQLEAEAKDAAEQPGRGDGFDGRRERDGGGQR
jgi:hypothetical protein